MIPLTGLSIQELAYVVCSAFDRQGIVAVLAGGGAAAFYAPASRETHDLDFVLHLELFGLPKASILTDLGFYPSNAAGTYKHDETPFTLEILRGPLAVGEETLGTFQTLRKNGYVLHIISATDSVKDRLAHGIYFKDLNAVRQAAEVARAQAVDLDSVKDWCMAEGASRTYDLFEAFRRT